MIPILLKPSIWSLKNYLLGKGTSTHKGVGRDLVLALLSASIMALVYRASYNGLLLVQASSISALVQPALIIEVILVCLVIVQMFSCTFSSISCLFFSNDLELLRSAPLRSRQIFWGKTLQIASSSTWMIIVFIIPPLLAIGSVYQANLNFYFMMLVLLPALILIPSIAAVIMVVLLVNALARRFMQAAIILCGSAIIIGIITVIWVVPLSTSADQILTNPDLRLLLTTWQSNWLPSNWIAQILGAALQHKTLEHLSNFTKIFLLTSALIIFGHLTFAYFYENAFNRMIFANGRANIFFGSGRRLGLTCFSQTLRPHFALFTKEYRLFVRDIYQAAQMLLLLGICFVYLYNFSLLKNIESLPVDSRLWWRGLLTLVNTALGGFVITAISTRFVFPATSMEGQTFWILQKAPLTFLSILRAKFICWFLPVALISSVVLGAGALAINAEPRIIAISAFTSIIISYGLVGLATGLGAYFAKFDWHHSSQLTASLGSLIYMLAGGMLIIADVIPLSFLIVLRTLRYQNYHFEVGEWTFMVATTYCFLVILNYSATHWALNLGSKALEQQRN